MSIHIVNRVLHHGPDQPHLRLLLVAIAAHANDHGQAWPSITRLAAMTCVHPRNAQRAIRWLEKDGWVTVTRQNGSSNRYSIDLDRLTTHGAHATPGAHAVGHPEPTAPTPPHPRRTASSTHGAHATRTIRTVNELTRSGVSPPPNGAAPALTTPEQTAAYAGTIRANLKARPRPPP